MGRRVQLLDSVWGVPTPKQRQLAIMKNDTYPVLQQVFMSHT